MRSTTIILAGLLFSGCVTTTETSVIKITEPITSIDALTDSGNLSFLPSEDGTIRIEQTFRYFRERPVASAGVVDGVLSLRGECPPGGFSCAVDFVVYTPTAISLLATSRSGDIETLNIEGPLTLTTNSGNIDATNAIDDVIAVADSGDIDLTSIIGEVTANTDSGDVTLIDINGDVNTEASSGDVTMSAIDGDISVLVRSGNIDGENLSCAELLATANSGDVELSFTAIQSVSAEVNSGNVTLNVPTGQYRVDASTNSGDVELNGLSNDSSAERSLTAHTDSGDIQITAR